MGKDTAARVDAIVQKMTRVMTSVRRPEENEGLTWRVGPQAERSSSGARGRGARGTLKCLRQCAQARNRWRRRSGDRLLVRVLRRTGSQSGTLAAAKARQTACVVGSLVYQSLGETWFAIADHDLKKFLGIQ